MCCQSQTHNIKKKLLCYVVIENIVTRELNIMEIISNLKMTLFHMFYLALACEKAELMILLLVRGHHQQWAWIEQKNKFSSMYKLSLYQKLKISISMLRKFLKLNHLFTSNT